MVPGVAIMLLTLAFMMMGNALRDALDVIGALAILL
jgi:peptide/nickel transport system permease protein